MNNQPQREAAIFNAAIQLPTPEQRAAYLMGACGDDDQLRQRVENLIREREAAGSANKINPADEIQTVVSERPLTDEAEGTLIGRYKLLEKLGEGGFGAVWLAEQKEPVRRKVALKIIKLGMDTKQVVARFEAERQALALMDHPNIAKVLDAGTTDNGRPYFVMELVRGIPLTKFCDENQMVTRDRLDLFINVCHAIQHAHQKGIIHRDIKPSNVLVTLHDGVPVPKVIDFGIAKATQGVLTDKTIHTQFQQFIGTPAYMSPEQAEMSGLDIDTRSDIYSLGVLLYELLVSKTPFDARELLASGLDEMRRKIREEEPVRPSTRLSTMMAEELATAAKRRGSDTPKLLHQLKGDLDWIVMKCLEKDRARRYETANGLAADLKRHLTNEPVIARPPSATYRFQKAFRRNKLMFTAATAVATTLVIGIGVSTWQTFEARKAQRATEVARKGEEAQRHQAQQKQAEAEAQRQRTESERQRADAQARKASESQQHSRRLLYASDMNLAQQSLKLNNLGKARRLLDRHQPQDGGEDLRGWEWRYLWQLTRSSALDTLTHRLTRGTAVSFSPDGTRLAAGWDDGRVDLWDVPGRQLVRPLTGYEHSHQGRVAFSPVRNLLAATSEPKAVTLYDLDSDRASILWRAGQGDWEVRDLSFSQDGSRLVIYAGLLLQPVGSTGEIGDAVWVVNVSSAQIESRHPTVHSGEPFHGAARLSPDNQRLYMARSDVFNYRYSIQCIDLATGREIWQTERERDSGLTALAVSPDGRLLASGSGYEDPTIRIWEAATGQLRRQLDGHAGWVGKLEFTRDGRRLISAASDQSIRFWETGNWTETKVLRGHTDEVHAVAISEPGQLVASAGKDGNLLLWKEDEKSAVQGYSRLPGDLRSDQVNPLDHSRVLLLPAGKPPELVDLKRDSPPVSLTEIGSSADVLGWFGGNLLCQWNGAHQILVRELRGSDFIQSGAITLDSGTRPTGCAYNATRQLLAWTEAASSNSVYVGSLATIRPRIELKSDLPGFVPLRFSDDGNYLVVYKIGADSLRAWNIETRKIVASINEGVKRSAFAADGQVLVVAIQQGNDHEICFYDLDQPDRAPRRFPGREISYGLAVSPDGGVVAASTAGGQVRLFDPRKGELIDPVHGHLNAAFGLAFSGDGRRLISAGTGREAVKLWDVATRQELLTLGGTGSILHEARWSADGDVILAGAPWQAWRAPSWEEIAAAEAKEKKEIQRP